MQARMSSWSCVFSRTTRRFGRRGGLCNGLGVVVVVLLSLHERLHIDRRDDPGLMAKLPQSTADKVHAETSLHADDAGRQSLEDLKERQSLDLATESDLAVSAETDDMEDFLADVDADRGQRCGGHGLLLRML